MAIHEPLNDQDYAAWRDANPSDYVINAEPGWGGYVLLHRATCTHMRSHPPFGTASYIKVCSDSAAELDGAGASAQRRGCPPMQGSGYKLLAALTFPEAVHEVTITESWGTP